MVLSAAGEALIKRFEQCRLVAYDDNGNAAGGVWTIGWGTTRYPNGQRVMPGDTCTQADADWWFRYDTSGVISDVDRLTTDLVSQRQADSLISFVYNVGSPAYQRSTLRRRVNTDVNGSDIRRQFMRYHYDNGVKVSGLWRRRHEEADSYFGVTTALPPMPRR